MAIICMVWAHFLLFLWPFWTDFVGFLIVCHFVAHCGVFGVFWGVLSGFLVVLEILWGFFGKFLGVFMCFW